MTQLSVSSSSSWELVSKDDLLGFHGKREKREIRKEKECGRPKQTTLASRAREYEDVPTAGVSNIQFSF